MNQLGVHLGGSCDGLMNFGVEAVKLGVRTFQMHLSNPRRWERPNGDLVSSFLKEIRPILDSSNNPNINLVIHGPFGVSLSKSEHYPYIMRYFMECSSIAESFSLLPDDRVRLVTHVGSRVKGMSVDDVITQVYNLCCMWVYNTTGHRSVFCLENDSGSKTGTKIGSVKFLSLILDKLKDFPRVRLCWDTEHAFANGMDLSNTGRIKEILSYSGVVHLNSVPSYVVKGGHLDRHSDDLIKNGQCVDELLKIAKLCRELDIPMILERSRSIVLDDYFYVKGCLNE